MLGFTVSKAVIHPEACPPIVCSQGMIKCTHLRLNSNAKAAATDASALLDALGRVTTARYVAKEALHHGANKEV